VKEDFDLHLNRKFITSPKTWLADFLAKCSQLHAVVLAVTCWHLWDVRNKLREEGGSVSPGSLAVRIKAYIQMIMEYVFKPCTDHRRETNRVVAWSPPPEGLLQLNVDAALFNSSHRMGLGVVVRDHQSTFIAAMVDSFPQMVVPELAEATAIRSSLLGTRGRHARYCGCLRLPVYCAAN
jgi:hypothetical protein